MRHRIRKLQGEAGFSLIELLVVIIILGVLASVVVFATQGLGDRGQANACEIDERTIATAQEAHYASKEFSRTYAANVGELKTRGFLNNESKWHQTKSDGSVFEKEPTDTNPCS